MDYVDYFLCFLPGCALAYAIYYLLGARRRAWIPPLVWWFSLALGAVTLMYGLSYSTMPSFSPQVTAVGKAYDEMQREIHFGRHSSTVYGFRFVPEGGESMPIETEIITPNSGSLDDFNGRTFRIVYLKDSERKLKNEAIDITILSGVDAGFHDSVDARLFGAWLGIPIGAVFGGFGIAGLNTMKKDAKAAELDEDDGTPS